MSGYVVHEEKYKGLTIKIIQDDLNTINPIEDWDMLGRQVYWHHRMDLGHCYKETSKYSPEEWLRKKVGEYLDINNWDVYSKKYQEWENWNMEKLMNEFEKFNLVIPVHAYEHSGIAISASGRQVGWDSFDSGQLGFVYTSHENILKEFGKKKLSKKLIKKAEEILISEVSTYNDYLNGNVWVYKILDVFDKELDSCWGFWGDWKYCLEEAKSVAMLKVKLRKLDNRKEAKSLAILKEKLKKLDNRIAGK